jgi:hypothetical protein
MAGAERFDKGTYHIPLLPPTPTNFLTKREGREDFSVGILALATGSCIGDPLDAWVELQHTVCTKSTGPATVRPRIRLTGTLGQKTTENRVFIRYRGKAGVFRRYFCRLQPQRATFDPRSLLL